MKKREIDPILGRLRSIANVKTDKGSCDFFHIKPNTMDVWKQRDSIPDKVLHNICLEHSLDFKWLKYGEEDQLLSSRDISLPYYPSKYVSAGAGAFPDLVDDEPIRFSKIFLKAYLGINSYNGLFLLDITGDSMEPTLRDRSLIFVNPMENEERIKDGAVYVMLFDNVMLVKRVSYDPVNKRYMLKSDNTVYHPIVVDNGDANDLDLHFIGRVVASLDRV